MFHLNKADKMKRVIANFKDVERYSTGIPLHGNTMLPATMTTLKGGRVYIEWDNG